MRRLSGAMPSGCTSSTGNLRSERDMRTNASSAAARILTLMLMLANLCPRSADAQALAPASSEKQFSFYDFQFQQLLDGTTQASARPALCRVSKST